MRQNNQSEKFTHQSFLLRSIHLSVAFSGAYFLGLFQLRHPQSDTPGLDYLTPYSSNMASIPTSFEGYRETQASSSESSTEVAPSLNVINPASPPAPAQTSSTPSPDDVELPQSPLSMPEPFSSITQPAPTTLAIAPMQVLTGMPAPFSPGAPFFNKFNITQFLDLYLNIC